jgi:SAM-dependent methyltransferase
MNPLHHILYQQTRLPVLQNRVFTTRDAARNCPVGDMCLVQDADTGLARNAAFDPSLLTYDSTYHNEQEYSLAFKQHLGRVADLVDRTLGRDNLVEVGCGKGYFLELLTSRGSSIIGFDPTYEGENPRVRKTFVDPSTSLRSNGIVLRHVLEHIPDPIAFLAHMRDVNGGRGRIYIEVPCFDWICRNRAWFDIFYEHVNYFRLEDFDRLFGEVVTSGRLFGDQYLYCVAELGSLRAAPREGWTSVTLPEDFLPSLLPAGRPASPGMKPLEAIWTCASKGVIFSLLRERTGAPIDVAIDINPKKQGLHLPGTGLRVLPPEAGLAALPTGSAIYVMNPIYAPEIMALGGDEYRYICPSTHPGS